VLGNLTLNQRLVVAVSIALTPVVMMSIFQGFTSYRYGQRLINERLISSALATAAVQREPVATAQQTLAMLAQNRDVLGMTRNCNSILRNVIRDQQQIVNYIRSDASGMVRCSVLDTTAKVSFASQDWWRTAIKARVFSLSRPTVGQVSKRRVLLAVQPIFDRDSGAFEGMVSAGIQLSWIETALQRTTLSDDAVAAVAGSDGTILVSAKSSTLKKIDVRTSFGQTAVATDQRGIKWLYSSAPIYDRQLFVVYAEPKNALVHSTRTQLLADIALPIIAVVLAGIAVWAGVNRVVTRWLRELGRLARQFASGDYAGSRYRFAGAPGEIAALSADLHSMATSIERRNADLESSASTTIAMAREVNHRVKNNLQLVISLLGLQAGQIKDETALLTLAQTRNRVAALGLVYRLMYDEGGNAEVGQVNLQRLITELCAQMRIDAIGGTGVELACAAPDETRAVDMAIPLTLFTVEAVTNAFRHGYPEGGRGQITVTLAIDTMWRLTIKDNGVGFDVATPLTTIGIELMHAFARQLNGDMTMESHPNDGTRIALSYPDTKDGVSTSV
jgi:two-component sensor histidine kinase